MARKPISEVRNPGAEVSSALARYRVQNLFQGFRDVDLLEGDIVEATEDEAAPYLGSVLTRIEGEL